MLKRTAVWVAATMIVAGLVLSGCQTGPQVTVPPDKKFMSDYEKAVWLQDQAASYAKAGKADYADVYYEEAIKTFGAYKKVRGMSPLMPLVNLRTGECFEGLGKCNEAVRAYDEVINTTPASPVRLMAEEKKAAVQKKIDAMKAEEARKAAEKKKSEAPKKKAEEPKKPAEVKKEGPEKKEAVEKK